MSSGQSTTNDAALLRTPLYDLHRELGAKLVPFAGYEMPVQYAMGVLKEHQWTRLNAGLFDVSHMGQAFLIPEDGRFGTAALFLETLVAADLLSLKPGQQRYTQLLNEQGGILDDLMVTRLCLEGHDHWLYLVVNAARKADDLALLARSLPDNVKLRKADDLALLALQGPQARQVMSRFAPELSGLTFMQSRDLAVEGMWMHVTCSGYTGEDGFEISLKHDEAKTFWSMLLDQPEVEAIGLGARDSLRLEAGLCLYGHDIDETTSPVEAGLAWSIQKRRRLEGGFPGADRILRELSEGPVRKLVGIRPEGRAPAREGTVILDAGGSETGLVTSGGFGPSVKGPVAMGYVAAELSKPGTPVQLVVRGKPMPAKVVRVPFMPHNYHRKAAA
ncbi:MAG TPA: glycine cleavage system aminomethyltransferase GcvT [Rhizobiales bacterium]|nr:glycine cleavage system aminomethyltransferase GcvT [Hyphomicrobiales bacterium]